MANVQNDSDKVVAAILAVGRLALNANVNSQGGYVAEYEAILGLLREQKPEASEEEEDPFADEIDEELARGRR